MLNTKVARCARARQAFPLGLKLSEANVHKFLGFWVHLGRFLDTLCC